MKPDTHFPVTRSVLRGAALADIIEKTYGLDVSRCRLIKAVILATYHVVAGDEQYILRIYPHERRSRAMVEEELSFLDALHREEIPVSVPVPALDGRRLFGLKAPEGERLAALFTYAPGRPLVPEADLTKVRTYGHLLANVHRIGDGVALPQARSPLDFDRLVAEPLACLRQTFPERAQDWVELQAKAPSLRAMMDGLGRRLPRYGLCHGDVNSANVHVADDGRLTLFDFDFCAPGWRIYDVSAFLIDTSKPVADSFRAGYEEVRPLEPQELATIPAFQAAQKIWMLGVRASYVDEWGTTHFSEPFVDRVLAAIRRNLAVLKGDL